MNMEQHSTADYVKYLNGLKEHSFNVSYRKAKSQVLAGKWTEFVADTETSSYANYEVEGRVRIILWGIESLDGSVYFSGYDGESLYDCLVFLAKIYSKATIYFHNAKFDWSYIAPVLMNHGYFAPKEIKYRQYLSDEGLRFVKKYASKQIDVMRSVRGSFYQAHIQVAKKQEIKIVDSMKFYPGKLSTYGDIFQIKKLYGDFDYEKYRPLDYKFNDDEKAYFEHDIEILRRMMVRKANDGKLELTRAGYAYNELVDQTLRDVYNEGSTLNKINKLIKPKFNLSHDDLVNYNIHANPKFRVKAISDFSKIFPTTNLRLRNELVDAYSGGFVWYDDDHSLIGKGVVYDCNSEYPAAMMNSVLPFGEEHEFSGLYSDFLKIEKENNEKYDVKTVAIFKLKAKFKLKEDTDETKYFPTLPKKYSQFNTFVKSDNDLKARFDSTLTLTNFDLIEFFKNYDVSEVDFIKGYWWLAETGMFKAFVNYFAGEKVKQTKGRDECLKWLKDNKGAWADDIKKKQAELAEHKLLRSEAKQTINSGYGKFAQSQINPSTAMELGDDGIVRYETLVHSEFDTMDALSTEGKYFPAGIFITAGARQILFKAMHTANKRVRYIDTDSVHLEGQEPVKGMDCDQARLGAWKIESKFDKGHYLRPKSYEEFQTFPTNKNGEPFNKVTLAGFDSDARSYYFKDFGHLKFGKFGEMEVKDGRFNVKNGTQTTVQVPGGTLIVRKPKRISPIKLTGEAMSEIMREADFRIYKRSFWQAWGYAVKNNDLKYFKDKLDELNEFIKSSKIENLSNKDAENPYREMIMNNLDQCFEAEAFVNEFEKEYDLDYNKTNEELGLI